MLDSYPAVTARLSDSLIGWLTTVNQAGQPQSSAVWHIVEGAELIVYSRPDATRLTNLRSNPKVSYNLRGDRQGDSIVTMEGIARTDPAAPTPLGQPAYMMKYGDEMIRIGWSHEQYDEQFPIALRIEITRVRAT